MKDDNNEMNGSSNYLFPTMNTYILNTFDNSAVLKYDNSDPNEKVNNRLNIRRLVNFMQVGIQISLSVLVDTINATKGKDRRTAVT